MLATVALVQLRAAIDRAGATDRPTVDEGLPAPQIAGTTLDGEAFSLTSLRGRPVIVNFWGPSCVPCRDEFPLFLDELAEHGDEGLAIIGVLMFDPPAPARDFVTEFGATWPTVDDPDGAFRTTYRVAGRPQSYFVDRDGIVRSIQVGELTQAEFDRQYAAISGPPQNDMRGSTGPQPAATPAPGSSSRGSASRPAAARSWRAWTWWSGPAKSSRSSAPTAPERRRPSRSLRAIARRTRARRGCSGWIRGAGGQRSGRASG